MAIRQGRLPGDRRVRAERVRPQSFRVGRGRAVRRRPRRPEVGLAIGFLVLIGIGTAVLMLPIASTAGTWTHPFIALFTATSAVCVTGLVVVDTATHWSPFGQVAILALIQVGGLGFMTGSTLLLLLAVGRRTALSDRIVAQESAGARDLGSVRFVLRRVVLFTLIAEGIGAVMLTLAFLVDDRAAGQSVWFGLFHSISAFNNAGFDLMGDFRGLTAVASSPLVLLPIAALIVLGGLGVAIVGDLVAKRDWARLALETKLVVSMTLLLILGGMLAFLVFEWSNPKTLGALPEAQRPLNALFESVSMRSAGMSTIPIGALTGSSLIVAIALMFIGTAPGSTGGGIKLTTFSILLATIVSTFMGRPHTAAFGRRVPEVVVYRALSVALLSVAVVFGATLLLELTSGGGDVLRLAFEVVSAYGTVGHSTGITPSLQDASLLLLTVMMFVGRLGPLTFFLALTRRARPVPYRPAVESIRIG